MLNPQLQSQYRRGVKWSLAGSTATALLQLGQMVIFARLAGPAAAGDYALATAVIGFLLPVAEAGLAPAIIQAEHIDRRMLWRLTGINFVLGLTILLGVAFLAPSMAQWYKSEGLTGLLLIMASSLLFTPVGAQRSALLTRSMRFDAVAKIESCSWVVAFLATTLLAWIGWGARSMAIGFLLRHLVVTIGGVIACPRLPVETTGEVKTGSALRFGFFDLSSRWAEFLANYLDKLLVGKWLGMEALGYYNLAFTFLMLPTARIGYVFTRVTFPLYARLRAETSALQTFFEQSSRELVLVLFPLYAALGLFAHEITWLLFGPAWLPVVPFLQIFAFAGFIRTLSTPFPQLMRGLGKPQHWLVWLLIFTASLNLALFLFLWHQPSALTAVWSRTVVKLLIELPMLWYLAQLVGLQFSPVLRFAAQYLLFLMPLTLLTWAGGTITASFWYALTMKGIIWVAGLAWLYRKKPAWQEIFNPWKKTERDDTP